MIPMLSRNGQQCEADSYVQGNKPYPVDARSEAYGSCDRYAEDGVTGDCILYATEQRGVVGVLVREDSTFDQGYFSPVGASPHVFDTRVTGTTTPENMNWYFYYEGLRTLRYRASFAQTACLMPPAWKEETINFRVLNCLPMWNRTTPTAPIVHVAPQTINVYIDPTLWPNMDTGIRQAITALNAALDPFRGTTQLPTFVPTTSGPCGGPYCINMRAGTPPGTACAGGPITFDPSTGAVISSNNYWPVTSSSMTWGVNFITRTALHELEHHLGLQDNSAWCPLNSTGSVMGSPIPCGATSGYPTSPTLSDITPIVRSVYGGQSTKTCPSTN
ncbi:MAG TPA: hypothetical protein VFK57_08025 [Vicinamibacterales bacterium]|nr:hypothetical protein [Vicinamibacterales bacterium]